jgi:hypothetical protein
MRTIKYHEILISERLARSVAEVNRLSMLSSDLHNILIEAM